MTQFECTKIEFSTFGYLGRHTSDLDDVVKSSWRRGQDYYFRHTITVDTQSDGTVEHRECIKKIDIECDPSWPPLGEVKTDGKWTMFTKSADNALHGNAAPLLHAAEAVLDMMSTSGSGSGRSASYRWRWRLGRRRQDDMPHLIQMDRCEIWNNLMNAVRAARGAK